MVVSGSGKGSLGEESKDLRVASWVKGLGSCEGVELSSVTLEIVLDLSWTLVDIKCNYSQG
jgi:hypothetical protein